MSYRVGLTGGIGSGKSTVASIFAELGVPVIDTDVISHQLTQRNGAAIAAIQVAFGKDYINANGTLDRTKMRQLVFSDNSAKQRLENILHPLILAQVHTLADSYKTPYVLVVIPLLFESTGYKDWLHRTATVDCAEETQLARATSRSGLSEQIVRAIMAQQFSRAQRIQLADDIINNNSSLAELHQQITKLHQNYLSLAKRSN